MHSQQCYADKNAVAWKTEQWLMTEDNKANMRHGRKTMGGSWRPAFPYSG